MKEFRSIDIYQINRDLEQLQDAWNCLDEIVHVVRTTEYPEDLEDYICVILEKYGIDCSVKNIMKED